MKITIQCPACRAELSAATTPTEHEAECPACGAQVTIPGTGVGPGTLIADFQVVRRLGRGGMGEVFLATQLSLERPVALKILPLAMASAAGQVERFRQEVRLLARVEHPNIVTAFAGGMDGEVPYFAMAYVDGEALHTRLKREGPLPEVEALRIARDVARALGYAWDRHRLIHRDIKPSNIMIDRRGTVKVMDFGLSKSLTDDLSLTGTGKALGTPHYMSPEQALSRRDLDCRSDIYSLGATLYHLVAGVFPYTGSTSLEILTKHVQEPLTSARKHNPAVTRPCDRLLRVLMAKAPDARPSTWDRVIEELDRVRQGHFPITPLPAKGTKAPGAERLPGAAAALRHDDHITRRWLTPRLAWAGTGTMAVVLICCLAVLVRLVRDRGSHDDIITLAAAESAVDDTLSPRTSFGGAEALPDTGTEEGAKTGSVPFTYAVGTALGQEESATAFLEAQRTIASQELRKAKGRPPQTEIVTAAMDTMQRLQWQRDGVAAVAAVETVRALVLLGRTRQALEALRVADPFLADVEDALTRMGPRASSPAAGGLFYGGRAFRHHAENTLALGLDKESRAHLVDALKRFYLVIRDYPASPYASAAREAFDSVSRSLRRRFGLDLRSEDRLPSPPTDGGQASADVLLRLTSSDVPLVAVPAFAARSEAGRRAAAARHGRAEEIESAVAGGLRWLRGTQSEDGSWSQSYPEAMAGLALLAFLGHGDTHESPGYGATVLSAMQFLARRMRDVPPTSTAGCGGRAYTNAVVAYALAEAYGMLRLPALRPAAQKGLSFVVAGQQASGAWDYEYSRGQRWDLSVSAWQIQALHAGRVAGVGTGVTEALRRTEGFLKTVSYRDGRFGYSSPGLGSWAMQGAGALSLRLIGQPDAEQARTARLNIGRNHEVAWRAPAACQLDTNPCYDWYYETRAMFDAGTAEWARWYGHMSQVLLANQQPDGHWVSPGAPDKRHEIDACYTTALCCLILESCYRYLPGPCPPLKHRQTSITALDSVYLDALLGID